MVTEPKQIRVLVVSASPYTRYVISGELSTESDLFVVGTARTPDEIAHKHALLRPDLAVVDLESPRDLTGFQQAVTETNLPMLVTCSHTDQGAELAFAALEMGAIDLIARPESDLNTVNFKPNLLRKVRGLAQTEKRIPKATVWPEAVSHTKATPRRFQPGDRLVVVSTSAGGLGPLTQLLTGLPPSLDASFLILSWLSERYLRWFLQHVCPPTSFRLCQARDGMSLKSGVIYFAPNDYHLTLGTRGYLTLDHSPPRNGVRPSADVTLSSLATQYGPAVIGVFLSGIGVDGVQGALDVYTAGGSIIVQDTSTCLVDETAAAIIASGAATRMLPPEELAGEIMRQTPSTPGTPNRLTRVI